MKIYIDNDNKCHVSDDGTMREFDVPFFDGKCAEFIEGYRYVPKDEEWARSDGEVFKGEMISPWKPYDKLYKAQLEYEIEQYKAALTEIETALGVTSE
jgi:hypothetical protein